MAYEKLVKEGKVAVIISNGFGAGWYTWNREFEGLLFDRELVEPLLQGDLDQVEKVAERKYAGAYLSGFDKLEVVWVKEGELFYINDYDGSESLKIGSDFLIA